METIIKAENLSYTYTNVEGVSHDAIRGMDINIKKGEFVAVLGHNGSGKSTFAKHLNAILLPSGGKVWVKGMDTSDEELLYHIRQTIGMVFQNPDNQIVATVVEEDVAFAPENLGVPPKEIRQRVDDALKAVGMYKYIHHSTTQLSGGQKQRVAIAGIIAMQPECIVMDEPTAMLDPIGRREVMRSIKKLNKELGITVVLITHHMNEAAMADRIIVMNAGKKLMTGTPREVFARSRELYEVGLAVPQTVELVQALQAAGVDVNTDVLSVEECAQAVYDALQRAKQ